MAPEIYPPGSVRALLQTDLVTPATREALETRLQREEVATPRFFDPHPFATLRAACARLIPQTEDAQPLDLAGNIDERLAEGKCDGWRYDALPPDGETYTSGLRGLDESARARHGADFLSLNGAQQDDILEAVRCGETPGAVWETLPGPRFFEELLAELTECYYCDPLSQEKIGYAGMADARGWRKIGLNEREDWEPEGSPHPALVGHPSPVGTREGPLITAQVLRTTGRQEATESESPALAQRLSSPSHWPLSRSDGGGVPDEGGVGAAIVDAVIIGTGAGGAPLMARLAQAGLSVVALEAGRHWKAATDFATDERAQAKLFWNDERLSAGGDPTPFGNNNSGCGVGGSTLHYTAYTPRMQPDDLCLYSEFGVGRNWPLAFEDLEPYYDELEAFLGVSGPSPYPWGPRRRAPYPLAPLPLNGAAQLMQRACAKLGIQTSPAANAALSAPYYQPGVGWRRACTNRGFCQAGCSVGAKASMDVTFVPLALGAGAELRPECFVTTMETDKTGRVSGVVYTRADGTEHRQRCRAVFLCAGAVETPRLLLLNGLANASGQVGRNFMAHTGLQLWGQFDEAVRPYKGIPGALISEDTHRPKDADFAGGYLLQSIGVMPVTYASQTARGRGLWGEALKDHMRGYNHTAGINILGDCLPSPDNYLELSDEKDTRGLPKPRIHFTSGENEKRLTAHADKIMRAIWAEAGARDVWAFQRSAHTIGTCRMGDDSETSVVNADGRCHDVPNLYISDNSTFPSALSANPALTIMALSLRTADRFLERANRGEN